MSNFDLLDLRGFYVLTDYKLMDNVRPNNRKKLCVVTQMPLGMHKAFRVRIVCREYSKKPRQVWISEMGMGLLRLNGMSLGGTPSAGMGLSQRDLASLYHTKRLKV